MNLSKYPLSASKKLTTFEFISEGSKGKIYKIVQYSPTNLKDVYNLAFGDKNNDTGKLNDVIVSNNGDSEKVLATVIATLYAFTDKYPDVFVYATGSTTSRTRMYRMGITKYLKTAKSDFDIYGELKTGWEIFKPGIEYQGFLVKRK